MVMHGSEVEGSVASLSLDINVGLVGPGEQLHHLQVAVFAGPVEASVAGGEGPVICEIGVLHQHLGHRLEVSFAG